MKNLYLQKKLVLHLMVFGLQIWIMLHFTGLDWKSYGQQFIITLIRYFSAIELEITQTMNLEYDY